MIRVLFAAYSAISQTTAAFKISVTHAKPQNKWGGSNSIETYWGTRDQIEDAMALTAALDGVEHGFLPVVVACQRQFDGRFINQKWKLVQCAGLCSRCALRACACSR
jgi:hypothetical protein